MPDASMNATFIDVVVRARGNDEGAAIGGAVGGRTGVSGSSNKYQDFQTYMEGRERAIFKEIEALYGGTASKVHTGVSTPAKLQMPYVVMDCGNDAQGAIASYNGYAITFYKRAYKLFKTMKAAEQNGDKAMADKIAYSLDQIVGHELGHALLHTSYFNYDPHYSYSSGAYRRKDDGLAEVIGFYVAQKVNGKQTDNGAVADAILLKVKAKAEDILIFNDKTRREWQSLTAKEKRDRAYEAEIHGERLIYYDYPLVGFATALKANPSMDLAEFIATSLENPQKLRGLTTYVTNIRGKGLQVENAPSLVRIGMPVDGTEMDKQMALQSDVYTDLLNKVNALLKGGSSGGSVASIKLDGLLREDSR